MKEKENFKILILGGTGAIGENLVKILSEHTVKTWVTSRKMRENHGSVTYIQGNAHDFSFLNELCKKKWDAVIDFMSYKTEELASRIDALLSCTNQYFFISSARVYADEEHPIKESSPRLLDVCDNIKYLSTDEYALTKARQEDLIKTHAFKKNYTIVRPYITYGNNRLQLGVLEKEEWLYRALQGHSVIFCEEIARRTTTMTNGTDVALGIYNLIGKEAAKGEVFHITSEHLRTWNDIIKIYTLTYKKATGKDLKIKMVPLKDFLKCRNQGLEWQVFYDRLYNRDFDTTKESEYVDSNSFTVPEEGLSQSLMAFLESGQQFRQVNIKNEAHKDKLAGESFKINELPTLRMKVEYFFYRYIL